MVTTMEMKDLLDLGLTKNETKVYLALIRFRSAAAYDLIRETKLHKKLVYENLERLIDKGLASFVIQENKKIFQITSPDMLVEYFEEQADEIEDKRKKAMRIAKDIKKTRLKLPVKQGAAVYRGIKGIKAFYRELLSFGKDYIVFGAPEESLRIMGEHFWLNFNLKRKDKRIHARTIFNESIRAYGAKIKNKLTTVRYFEKDFEPRTETNVQHDRIAIIVWTEEPVLFLIKNKVVADSYRNFFEKMWKEAKP